MIPDRKLIYKVRKILYNLAKTIPTGLRPELQDC